jgi:predicted acetylornithine/succinylornithine family transaminase
MKNDNNLVEKESEFIYNIYSKKPFTLEKAEGTYLYDNNSNKYLDFLSGIAVNALGNRHPVVIEAIENQIKKYLHVSNFFHQESQIKLAEKLIEITGLSKVYFSNSGTESTEAAIKLTRAWANPQAKNTIIAIKGAFHGRTYGALSLMEQDSYKKNMYPFLENIEIIDSNDNIDEIINDDTAAIIFEVIQGEGGIRTLPIEFINSLIKSKAKHDFLIIVDEIQSGIGRTGKYFAYQNYNINPDIILSAKALGGGLPLGAIICSEKVSNTWQYGQHGTTFGGNAVACAAGLAVLNFIDVSFLNDVKTKGDYLSDKLNKLKIKYPKIAEIRGLGLMIGIKFNEVTAGDIVEMLFKNKVLVCKSSDNVVRILPPLNVSYEEIDIFTKELEQVLNEI